MFILFFCILLRLALLCSVLVCSAQLCSTQLYSIQFSSVFLHSLLFYSSLIFAAGSQTSWSAPLSCLLPYSPNPKFFARNEHSSLLYQTLNGDKKGFKVKNKSLAAVRTTHRRQFQRPFSVRPVHSQHFQTF